MEATLWYVSFQNRVTSMPAGDSSEGIATFPVNKKETTDCGRDNEKNRFLSSA